MKRELARLITLVAVAGLALFSTIACSGSPEGTPQQLAVTITCDEFQQSGGQQQTKTATVARGGAVTVTLCSNPTTGYSWEPATISDPTVLALNNHQYLAPQSATPLAGGAGQEQWVFEAAQAGTTTVAFRYSQPWTGGAKNAWTLDLTVTVD